MEHLTTFHSIYQIAMGIQVTLLTFKAWKNRDQEKVSKVSEI